MANGAVLARAASAQLARLIAGFPVVIVSGPRRTGKSTLVQTAPAAAAWNYRSLDAATLREEATTDPESFVARVIPAVIDEVQRVPDLMIAIKAQVDRDIHPAPGQFLLTGSADILNHPRITESLAGRAAYMRLGPLTRNEIVGQPRAGLWTELFDAPSTQWRDLLLAAPARPEDWRTAVRHGGLPEIVRTQNDAERADRLLAYTDTYLERDLRDLAQVDSLSDFRRVMRVCALRVGNLFNAAAISRDVQVPATTLKRWVDLLEISYLLVRVEAFTVNRTSRLMKSPKVYWSDTALGLFLSGSDEPSGAHLENLILADLLVWRDLQAPRPSVMHWRSTSGREVDFVVEQGNRLIALEVKATSRPTSDDTRHLRAFIDEYSDMIVGGLLLHTGEDVVSVTDRLVTAPWWRVI